jgi:hypothetical protein
MDGCAFGADAIDIQLHPVEYHLVAFRIHFVYAQCKRSTTRAIPLRPLHHST